MSEAKVLQCPAWIARPSEAFKVKLTEGEQCEVLTFHAERLKRGKIHETQAGE